MATEIIGGVVFQIHALKVNATTLGCIMLSFETNLWQAWFYKGLRKTTSFP